MRTKLMTNSKLWQVKNFDFAISTNEIDFVVQKAKLMFRFVLGEYWLDITKGIPYFSSENAFFEKNVDFGSVEAILKAKLKEIEHVKEITSFEITVDGKERRMKIEWSVTTTSGDIIEEEETI